MFLFRKRPEMPSPADALPGRPTPLPTAETHFVNGNPLKGPYPPGIETIVLGLGCFWGAERKFWQLPEGVFVTAVGYAGGYTPNPTYEEVCTGQTGHNEVVLVAFDPAVLPLERCCGPSSRATTRPRACARATMSARSTARGSTRTIRRRRRPPGRCATAYAEALRERGFPDITTEIKPLEHFYFAEDYHQQYLAKNPSGYCGLGGTGVSCPVGTGVAA